MTKKYLLICTSKVYLVPFKDQAEFHLSSHAVDREAVIILQEGFRSSTQLIIDVLIQNWRSILSFKTKYSYVYIRI